MASITVTTSSDAPDHTGLSLRDAIAEANATSGADVISFATGSPDIQLQQGQLEITSTIVIDGGSAGRELTIDGNDASRVLSIQGDGIEVWLDELTITGGSAAPDDAGFRLGGGVMAGPGTTLLLTDTNVTGNSAGTGAGTVPRAYGGGIYAGGKLILRDSAVEGNNAIGEASRGGGIWAVDATLYGSTVNYNHANGGGAEGGGIYGLDTLALTNSTVAGNIAAGTSFDYGGGIFAHEVLTINGSTITGNKAENGGGVTGQNGITLANSIVVGNGEGYYADIRSLNLDVTSNVHNLIGYGLTTDTGDRDHVLAKDVFATTVTVPGTTTLAGEIAFNGGLTETAALLVGGLAQNAGLDADAIGPTDQRGPGYARLSGSQTDIGAFEIQQVGGAMRLFTPGDDAIDLRKANLTLYPGALGSDALAGDDTVYLSNTQNLGKLFIAGQGEDTLFGGSRDDKITGSQGDDRIGGGGGDDLLYGGIGNDRLHGDGGADTLKGSAGEDTFIFTKVGDSPAGAGRDVILDFTSRQGDLVDLAKIDANAGLAGNQAFVWKGDDPLTGVGQLHYRHVGGDTIVEGNVSGSAAPEIQIELHGHLTLAAGDFLL